ncbi:Hypothetical predicted protein [Olea europaea subsp. europaea]|uniref:Uncharacterized protein n=1 Tax=Olea europaea subsp. europaea TaxID=158383 RepID=A0A8S0QAK9_OLEEU|nr:Hypothetical predicted protein [Olea europaea subsp. europaea]
MASDSSLSTPLGQASCERFTEALRFIEEITSKADIRRIANGDRSPILCSYPIFEFLTSSGTSAGKRKLMPTIAKEMERRQNLYSLLMPVIHL